MTGLGTYLKSVAGWGRVRPEDAAHAGFIGNALEAGQGSYQASVGWALTEHNNSVARLPRKLRKPPARVVHEGRVTRRVKK